MTIAYVLLGLFVFTIVLLVGGLILAEPHVRAQKEKELAHRASLAEFQAWHAAQPGERGKIDFFDDLPVGGKLSE